MQLKRFLTLTLFAAFTTGVWAQVTSPQTTSTATGGVPGIPRSKHVVVVTLENHSYEQVVGSSQMPYFNQLISQYAIADQYYATMHNSLSALMRLTAGQTVTTNDNTMQFFNVDNIVRHMQASGRTWKSYQSELPYVGYLGYNVGEYVKRHNPLAYFTDVESSLKNNIVPADPNFQNDIANSTLPEYSYVTPDLLEDAHDGTPAQADAWLKANIPQLLGSPQFQKDGILFIVWDEGNLSPVDPRNGGGRVATVVIGPQVKRGYHSQIQYNHQSLLRSTCLALALTGCPGGGAEAVPMTDMFQASGASMLQVNLASPAQNAVNGTVHLQANGIAGANPATGMAAYAGGKMVARSTTPSLTANLNLAPGTYVLTVRAWDTTGAWADLQRTITVTAPQLAVNLVFPTTTYVGSPVHIQASGVPGASPAGKMAAYMDGTQVAQSSTPNLNVDVPATKGSHTVTVKVWDTAGHTAQTQYSVTVQ
jgi:phosphatidylinositol-3-phosphatase